MSQVISLQLTALRGCKGRFEVCRNRMGGGGLAIEEAAGLSVTKKIL